jgi:hypothetical protein
MVRLFLAIASVCSLLGCASQNTYQHWISEKPPCRLSPLSNAEVLAIARDTLGETYSLQPEPLRRITDHGCVYEYEQSLLSDNGKPDPLESLSPSASVLVKRDRRVMVISP